MERGDRNIWEQKYAFLNQTGFSQPHRFGALRQVSGSTDAQQEPLTPPAKSRVSLPHPLPKSHQKLQNNIYLCHCGTSCAHYEDAQEALIQPRGLALRKIFFNYYSTSTFDLFLQDLQACRSTEVIGSMHSMSSKALHLLICQVVAWESENGNREHNLFCSLSAEQAHTWSPQFRHQHTLSSIMKTIFSQ